MPLSQELTQAIIDDLREDRLDFEEIAAKHLGDAKKKVTISRIAQKAGLSRKDRRGKSRRSFKPKVSSEKSSTKAHIKIETFGPETRLSLIDEAITNLKSLLPEIKDSYKMDRWSAALERLLEQRREEEQKGDDHENTLLTKIVGALDIHAESIFADASSGLSRLPENQNNTDVRLCQKREN